MKSVRTRAWAVLVGVAVLAAASCSAAPALRGEHTPARDPLLAASRDLGPSRARDVEALVALTSTTRPQRLVSWAAAHRLAVRWHAGDGFALVRGPAYAMAGGFAVPIDDFVARSGRRFYAAERPAAVPAELAGAVTNVGSISSYVPAPRIAMTRSILQDVPEGGLTPAQLLTTYGATSLAQAGDTGAGATIVFFEIDGFRQSDLDTFTRDAGLSRIVPVLASGQPGGKADGIETPMDLEVAHAIVPKAKLVVVDLLKYLSSAQSIARLALGAARAYAATDAKYPGAIWNLSIILSCDRNFTPADIAPMEQALQTAEKHGTSAFVSSGDTGGLECKGGTDYGDPPVATDVGTNGLTEPPSITAVGGTALSTDAKGDWIGEQTWTSSAMQQGTGGGLATDEARPSWQQASGISTIQGNRYRLVPDVAADADPFTGVKVFLQGSAATGGGTSQSAPIWAGLTVMMNQYLKAHGGRALGNINPLLYAAARTTPKSFHDITLGGNSVYSAEPGFDLVTGLGSPDVGVLVGALAAAQKRGTAS